MNATLRVKLVFTDWQKDGKSIYHTEEGIHLSSLDLHSGSTFDAEIEFPFDALESLRDAIALGAFPIFKMVVKV